MTTLLHYCSLNLTPLYFLNIENGLKALGLLENGLYHRHEHTRGSICMLASDLSPKTILGDTAKTA